MEVGKMILGKLPLYRVWKARYGTHFKRRRFERIMKLVPLSSDHPVRILEVGCSSGKDFIQFLDGPNVEIWGVDLDDDGQFFLPLRADQVQGVAKAAVRQVKDIIDFAQSLAPELAAAVFHALFFPALLILSVFHDRFRQRHHGVLLLWFLKDRALIGHEAPIGSIARSRAIGKQYAAVRIAFRAGIALILGGQIADDKDASVIRAPLIGQHTRFILAGKQTPFRQAGILPPQTQQLAGKGKDGVPSFQLLLGVDRLMVESEHVANPGLVLVEGDIVFPPNNDRTIKKPGKC